MAESGATREPATNLLRSLVQLGGTLLAAAQTRFDLLTAEISEDLQHGLQILLWAFVAVLAGTIGILLVGVTIILYYWDTHRLAAAVGVSAAFVLLALVAGQAFRRRLHEKPRLLDATRTELQRDVAALRREP